MSSTLPNSRRERLATFVHISDLHFGKLDPVTGDAEYSPLAGQTYRNFQRFDGLLGHHGHALKELHKFVADLRKREPDIRLIVSGDLTRCGHGEELELARDYIRSRIDINPTLQNLIGLRFGERVLVIPGNHDQWGGTPTPLGTGAALYGAVFHQTLPFFQSISLRNGKSVSFIGIDSDADVTALSRRRIFAIGAFQSELTKFDPPLPTKSPDEFRVVLIHHSWHQGPKLRIAKGSKWALGHFMYTNQISAMLCGHSHVPLLNKFQTQVGWRVRDVHELRSGSSTQLDVVPAHWKTWLNNLPAKPKWSANTLLVHRIYQCGSAMEWETETHMRQKRGFKPITGSGVTFPLV